MKYLSICIPNYGRLGELRRLLLECAGQIAGDSLEDLVDVCISDDCSPEGPESLVQAVREQYPDITVRYKRNAANMGMDHNFLNSVLLSESLYCWIMGNDDLPAGGGIKAAVDKLKGRGGAADLLVTPFEVFDSADEATGTVCPLALPQDRDTEFHTEDKADYGRLLWSVRHNSGLFGFLSNVVFKRERWIRYKGRFRDKMGTIFIQMYMNIQTLEDGAFYLYSPQKIVKNHADDTVNGSVKRICDILLGLDGVIEYFYHGEVKRHLKETVVDAYVSGIVWELAEGNAYKERIRQIDSEKSGLYRRFFIGLDEREAFFRGKKVILFGVGNYGEKALGILAGCHADVAAVVDSDPAKDGKMIKGYRIQGAEHIKEIYRQNEETCVVVANHKHLVEMAGGLLSQGIERLALIT